MQWTENDKESKSVNTTRIGEGDMSRDKDMS